MADQEFIYPEMEEAFRAQEALRVSIILTRLYFRLRKENQLDQAGDFECSLILPGKDVSYSNEAATAGDALRWLLAELDKCLEKHGDVTQAIPRIFTRGKDSAEVAVSA